MSLSEIIKEIISNMPTTVPKPIPENPGTPFNILNKELEKAHSQSKKRGKSRRK